jgi:hypothetical protein
LEQQPDGAVPALGRELELSIDGRDAIGPS